ncbi:MAG: hypothetical protein LBG70_00900 [Bifidobacteriaceae bacterium]|nr:hypothetical protein [Bifidobacteriaceae bacterium]
MSKTLKTLSLRLLALLALSLLAVGGGCSTTSTPTTALGSQTTSNPVTQLAGAAAQADITSSQAADTPAEQVSSAGLAQSPEMKAAQQQLAKAVTDFSTVDQSDNGIPNGWREGVVGFYGSAQDGYTMVLSADQDQTALPSFVNQLSALARSQLAVINSSVTTSALTDAWHKVFDTQWCSGQADLANGTIHWLMVHPNAQRGLIELSVYPDACPDLDLEKLQNVAPGLVEVQIVDQML